MDEIEWDTLKELFEQALALPPEKRTAFLDNVCAGDPTLREELDIRPASLTQKLYESIRTDCFDGSIKKAPAKQRATIEVAALHELLDSIAQLQTTLTDVQHRLQQEIDKPETALGERHEGTWIDE